MNQNTIINEENNVIVNIDNVDKYISQLSVTEKKAFVIAQTHLGTSFHIQKSNGYIQWLKKQPATE